MTPDMPRLEDGPDDDEPETDDSGMLIVRCKKCGQKLSLKPPKKPTTIRCGKCKNEQVVQPLKKKAAEKARPRPVEPIQYEDDEPANDDDEPAPKKAEVKCPKCAKTLRVPITKDAIQVRCPSCRNVREVRDGKFLRKEIPKKTFTAGSKLDTTKCSGCGREFIVPSHESEIQIRCPYCSAVKTLGVPTDGKMAMGIVVKVAQADYSVTCLNCGRVYGIPPPVGAMKSRCPTCNNVQLVEPEGSKPASAAGRSLEQVECPVCSHQFQMDMTDRPSTITCPKCRYSGSLA